MNLKEAYKLSNSKSDKDLYHNYGDTYDKLLKDFIDKPVSFLEIGLYEGESAKLWSYYFQNKNASFDFIDNTVEWLKEDALDNCYLNKRIKFHTSLDILKIEKEPYFKDKTYDIIIDDGCHQGNYQNFGLNYFLKNKKLNPGGIYIIEDIRFKTSKYGDPPNYPGCISGFDENDFEIIKVPNKKEFEKEIVENFNDNNLVIFRNGY